jgi:uncharacterized membrane protein (GlpM family)
VIGELALRFVLGGLIVCVFAAVSEVVKPKTFAGLFGAAPSVALATLGIAHRTKGAEYVGIEARSMLIGAAALLVYSATCIATTRKSDQPVWLGAALAWAAWAVVAFIGWWALLGGEGRA